MARVFVTADAQRQFDRLPLSIQARIEKIYVRLEMWPDVSGARALAGSLSGHYRLRTGDYRVQFTVKQDRVVIEKVGHRDGFYEE